MVQESSSSEIIRQKIRFGKEGKAIVFEPQIIKKEAQKDEQAIGEPTEALKVGQVAARDIDTHTWFEKAWSVIRETGSKAKSGKALIDDEVEEFNQVMDSFPKKETDDGQALRKDMAQMIVEVNGEEKNVAQQWKDLSDLKKIDGVRSKNFKLAALYDYIHASGGDPQKLDWQVVAAYGQALTESYGKKQISRSSLKALAEASIRDKKGQEEFYQKLLIREGYDDAQKDKAGNREWRDRQEREKAFDVLINVRQPEATIQPIEFLKRQYYEQAMKPRLESMRSSAVAVLEKSSGGQKMEIGRPKNPNHFRKGFSPDLAFNMVETRTVIGQFLDEVGEGGYWRGKACLDVLYWSFYKGQLMGDAESRSEAKDSDIFAKRKDVSQTLRQYAGAVALSYMEKDPRFVDTLNTLYNLNPGMSYEQKLQILSKKNGNFDVNGELPDFITDAVMFEKIYILDAMNMSRADLRIVAYHPAQIFDKELATDAEGKVYELLGKNMRLTESPLMKMGWWSASNTRFNYEAMVPDLRDYDPVKNPDQLDKIWQHCGMFLLELNDRNHSLTRKFEDKEEEITINGESMTALMGQTGEYQSYQNERVKRKKGEEKGVYDHRRGVFDRIRAMQVFDKEMRRNGGVGKAGWNEQLNPNNPRSLTVRQAVDAFVLFMQRDYSGENQLVINRVTIDKGANEIFYNDELAMLLNDFEANPNDPAFGSHRNELYGFLNMRNVLRDLSRCWGLAFDLNDSEVQKRLMNNQDLTFVENYDIAASESASIINELTHAAAYDDVYAIKVTPGKVQEAIEHMKHRRHGLQNYWPMFRLLRFVEMAMMRRLTEMEIASAQDLLKMVDPMGEGQLGAAEKVKKLIGTTDDLWEARNTIFGEVEKIGYMEEMTLSRLELQKRGLLGNWREAIRAHALRELAAEAFNWGLTRTLPLEQQAGVDDELAAGWQWLDREQTSMFPLQSWQIPDARISHDGEVIIEPLAIQNVNRVQLHEYFIDLRQRPDGRIDEDYGLQRAGNIFGGARKAVVVLQAGTSFASKPKGDKTTKNSSGFVAGRQQNAFIIQEHSDESGQQWYKVGREKEEGKVEEVGWIQQDELNIIGYEAQQFSEPLRPGEVRYDGGRFIWRHFDKGKISLGSLEQWKWIWVEGRYFQDQRRQDLVFIPGNGFKRQLKLGTKDSTKVLREEVEAYHKGEIPELLFDEATLGEFFLQDQNPKTKILHDANYPFVIFVSEEKRKKFYFGRGRMLFSLRMGSPVMAAKSEGFQAGANLPGWMYRTKVEGLGRITRFGDEVLKMMRLQIRVGIYRGGLITEIERHFGKVYLPDEVVTKLKKTYEKAMTGEQWGEDIEIMRKLITDTPFWSVLRNKQYSIPEKSEAAWKISWTDISNGLLKGASAFLRAKLPFDFAPFNIPTAIATTAVLGGYGWLGGAGLVRSLGIIGATGLTTSYLLGMVGVGFSRLIQPDLSRTNPFTLPGIQNFNAYVPVE